MGILFGSSSCILVLPARVSRLSQLQVDADKDWQGRGMANVRELAKGMVRGDLLLHNGAVIVRLSPGDIGDELTSDRPLPRWKPPPRGEG